MICLNSVFVGDSRLKNTKIVHLGDTFNDFRITSGTSKLDFSDRLKFDGKVLRFGVTIDENVSTVESDEFLYLTRESDFVGKFFDRVFVLNDSLRDLYSYFEYTSGVESLINFMFKCVFSNQTLYYTVLPRSFDYVSEVYEIKSVVLTGDIVEFHRKFVKYCMLNGVKSKFIKCKDKPEFFDFAFYNL